AAKCSSFNKGMRVSILLVALYASNALSRVLKRVAALKRSCGAGQSLRQPSPRAVRRGCACEHGAAAAVTMAGLDGTKPYCRLSQSGGRPALRQPRLRHSLHSCSERSWRAKMQDSQLVDPFGRRITYLRLSVTDRCDFRCTYCMSEDMVFAPRAQILTLEELYAVADAFISLGVR